MYDVTILVEQGGARQGRLESELEPLDRAAKLQRDMIDELSAVKFRDNTEALVEAAYIQLAEIEAERCAINEELGVFERAELRAQEMEYRAAQ